MKKPTYNDSVFINCPFDKKYQRMLRAMVFTVYRCGFYPITAMDEDNGLENRIDKITKLIRKCRYGIHDISRIELNINGYPRFNMPYELGIFYGARRFGDKLQKQKNALIFEKIKYTYQQYLSDINGIDTKAHNNNPQDLIESIRHWLFAQSRRKNLPSHKQLSADYQNFNATLPKITRKVKMSISEIPFNDYCLLVEEYLSANLK
jgi:hypothetical protein